MLYYIVIIYIIYNKTILYFFDEIIYRKMLFNIPKLFIVYKLGTYLGVLYRALLCVGNFQCPNTIKYIISKSRFLNIHNNSVLKNQHR